ncbi:hypothetical protein, conserved [Leishmania donovani]|uniref:Uncharacterized protein n=1 Tax=Leishmania donovani TaxID=5661 RepID=E9BQ26_LEIDO|nr:hypothetical protein, conserved [Leishmania donovani]CBZ37238.1 hypothetical protein, conserved [Leishmania donovani]
MSRGEPWRVCVKRWHSCYGARGLCASSSLSLPFRGRRREGYGGGDEQPRRVGVLPPSWLTLSGARYESGLHMCVCARLCVDSAATLEREYFLFLYCVQATRPCGYMWKMQCVTVLSPA